jgi:hypothetical protein
MSVPYPTTPEDIKQTEAALLGSLLLSPEQSTFVQAHVQPEDFVEDRHRLIYEALQAIPDTAAFDSIHSGYKYPTVGTRIRADRWRSVPHDAKATGRKHDELDCGPGLSPQKGIPAPNAQAGRRSFPDPHIIR